MTRPMVDVAIPTIGRPTLAQAILAGAMQTYRPTRVVVIGDGPVPEALEICARARALAGEVKYVETPKMFGHGNPVKAWWIAHAEAAPFVRFLDDDDWIPPESVELMMRAMGPDVSLVVGQFVHFAPGIVSAGSSHRIRGGVCAAHHATTATMLMRTEAARAAAKLATGLDDWARAQALAQVGRVAEIRALVYWAPRGQGASNRPWDIRALAMRRQGVLRAALATCADPRKRQKLLKALELTQAKLNGKLNENPRKAARLRALLEQRDARLQRESE